MATSVMWFRRDLRLADNPALVDAIGAADDVVPLFVFDPRLWDPAGPRDAATCRPVCEPSRTGSAGWSCAAVTPSRWWRPSLVR